MMYSCIFLLFAISSILIPKYFRPLLKYKKLSYPRVPTKRYTYPRIISNTIIPSFTVSTDYYITPTIAYVYSLAPLHSLASKRYNITNENIPIYSI